jgi:hypothetical protein
MVPRLARMDDWKGNGKRLGLSEPRFSAFLCRHCGDVEGEDLAGQRCPCAGSFPIFKLWVCGWSLPLCELKYPSPRAGMNSKRGKWCTRPLQMAKFCASLPDGEHCPLIPIFLPPPPICFQELVWNLSQVHSVYFSLS